MSKILQRFTHGVWRGRGRNYITTSPRKEAAPKTSRAVVQQATSHQGFRQQFPIQSEPKTNPYKNGVAGAPHWLTPQHHIVQAGIVSLCHRHPWCPAHTSTLPWNSPQRRGVVPWREELPNQTKGRRLVIAIRSEANLSLERAGHIHWRHHDGQKPSITKRARRPDQPLSRSKTPGCGG